MPFRESYHAVGALVRIAEASDRELTDLTVDEMRSAHPAFGDDAAAEVQLQELAKALREA